MRRSAGDLLRAIANKIDKPKPILIKLGIKVDGRVLAQAVADYSRQRVQAKPRTLWQRIVSWLYRKARFNP